MPYPNKQIVLRDYVDGLPETGHFFSREHMIDACDDGKVIVRNRFLSADPAQRGYMNRAANYARASLDDAMRALAVGEIVESKLEGYVPGDVVTGWLGWQHYAHVGAAEIIRKVDPGQAPIQAAIGVLGINGLVAYVGLYDVLSPVAGETVLVTTAAGAVGSLVGQLAKQRGCDVVGVTGSDEKVRLACDEFGYRAAINYKTGNLRRAIEAACPHGIDAYYDLVAGDIFDTIVPLMNTGGRIAQVGTASVASWDPAPLGPRTERLILIKELRHQGFVIFNHAQRFQAAIDHLSGLLQAGTLNFREEIRDGLESAPAALVSLYRGTNTGKTLIRLVG